MFHKLKGTIFIYLTHHLWWVTQQNPENTRKPYNFLMFSASVKRNIGLKWVNVCFMKQ